MQGQDLHKHFNMEEHLSVFCLSLTYEFKNQAPIKLSISPKSNSVWRERAKTVQLLHIAESVLQLTYSLH